MKKAKKNRRLKLVVPIVIVLLIAAYVIWVAAIGVTPMIKPVNSVTKTSSSVPSITLPWPGYGQSAIGINNLVVESNGLQKSVPMASTAKLITALCVLQKYPLSLSESGPVITLSASDVAIYNKYQAEDGSDMLIASGEQLSEYQMLESMLLPSADNIADSLAIWAFGSLNSYSVYANQYLKAHGLNDTHVGVDASGFDPSSVTSATDLIKLGELSMDNPVIAQIVSSPSASNIPLVGSIKNVNSLLGQDNIIGIKTGNTDQAGGVYLSASKVTVNDQLIIIYTAIMQAPTLFDALHSSLPLIVSAQSNFASSTTVASTERGAVVGEYSVPWNSQTISAIASQPIKIDSWGGSKITESVSLSSISSKSGQYQVVGSIDTSSDLLGYTTSQAAILNQSPGQPSVWWLLLHPQSFIHV